MEGFKGAEWHMMFLDCYPPQVQMFLAKIGHEFDQQPVDSTARTQQTILYKVGLVNSCKLGFFDPYKWPYKWVSLGL